MTSEIYIGVGSNIEPEKNILLALQQLMERVTVVAASSFYQTSPVGGITQPDYINGVWQVRTDYDAQALKYRVLRVIEDELGRKRSGAKNASRGIDLDLLLYGNRLLDADIYTRSFIAIPLFEINPALILPDTGRSLAGVVQAMDRTCMILLPEFTDKIKVQLTGK